MAQGSESPHSPLTDGDFSVPPRTGLVGLSFFLASLSMLFGGSMVAYLVIRVTGQNSPPLHTMEIPKTFWLSTFCMLASSIAMHKGLSAVRAGRQEQLRLRIMMAAVLAVAFLAVQTPSIYQLYLIHERISKTQNMFLYGVAMLLIALHAAHVIGGLIPLAKVTFRALNGAYTQRDYRGIQYCVVYWHFLDVVWITMFALLLITG